MSFSEVLDVLLHLNLYIGLLLDQYHIYAYLILMAVIFCETGLVVTPFLPGDSLLFASGLVFSTSNHHNIFTLVILLIVAAFFGDNSNYWIGRLLGRRLFERCSRVFKPEYLYISEEFYRRHGVMAIIFARFFPLLRTFVPFFAGLSRMGYQKYFSFSFLSACLWVSLFTLTGYYFGNIPWVQNNFSLVISLVILISMIPVVVEVIKHFCLKKAHKQQEMVQLRQIDEVLKAKISSAE